MSARKHLLLAASAAVALVGLSTGAARAADPPQFGRLATIQVPGNPLTQFDISYVDPATETYFLADRSNSAVDIFDATNNTFLARVGGFVGYDPKKGTDLAGPNGIVGVGNNEIWAGDGDSTVKVVNLESLTITDVISTGGTHRVDEMSYDARDRILAVANNADDPPFITLISTRSAVHGQDRILGKVVFSTDGSGIDATNGIEQSVYNPANGMLYVSVPQVGPDPALGAIAVVDPRRAALVATVPISLCQPSGLALGPRQHLLVGCSITPTADNPGYAPNSQVINARTGAIVSVVREVGGSDQVAYDPDNRTFYLAARNDLSGPVLGIISARTNRFLGKIPTAPNAHSVAADPINNHVFVPLTPQPNDPACTTGCIGVYGLPDASAATQ